MLLGFRQFILLRNNILIIVEKLFEILINFHSEYFIKCLPQNLFWIISSILKWSINMPFSYPKINSKVFFFLKILCFSFMITIFWLFYFLILHNYYFRLHFSRYWTWTVNFWLIIHLLIHLIRWIIFLFIFINFIFPILFIFWRTNINILVLFYLTNWLLSDLNWHVFLFLNLRLRRH